MAELPLPLTYRAEIIEPLVAALQAGESCSLVGVGSSGKSNILRHLARADVRKHYFGDAAPQTLLLYFDCNKLAVYTSQAVYGEIVELLAKTLTTSERPALGMQIEEWWQQTVSTESEPIARRNVERALDAAGAAQIHRVIILFDDCDALIAQAPAHLLRGLRALRDDYKGRLVFVAATRRDLPLLCPASPEFEQFFELLSAHVIYNKPHSKSDAAFMLRRLAARQEVSSHRLQEAEIERLLEISGHHAGLLKAIYFASDQGELALHPNAIALFVNNENVWAECQKIWESLEEGEQTALKAIVSGQTIPGNGLGRLKSTGLIVEQQDGTYAIFSPLLLVFVSASAQSARALVGPIITLRPDSPVVTIDGRTLHLDPVEAVLFRLLYERRPRTCSRTELIEALLRGEAGQRGGSGGPERRLQKALEQIRSKIEIPGRVYLISTADGTYRLVGQDGR